MRFNRLQDISHGILKSVAFVFALFAECDNAAKRSAIRIIIQFGTDLIKCDLCELNSQFRVL